MGDDRISVNGVELQPIKSEEVTVSSGDDKFAEWINGCIAEEFGSDTSARDLVIAELRKRGFTGNISGTAECVDIEGVDHADQETMKITVQDNPGLPEPDPG